MSDRLEDALPRGSRSTRKHSDATATHPVSRNTLMKLTPSIMQILHYHAKGAHLNTLEKFHIHTEFAANNHLNENLTVYQNAIFDTLAKTHSHKSPPSLPLTADSPEHSNIGIHHHTKPSIAPHSRQPQALQHRDPPPHKKPSIAPHSRQPRALQHRDPPPHKTLHSPSQQTAPSTPT